MQHITVYDYLLLPMYLFLFYILLKRKALRFSDPELSKIFLTAFGLRMLGAIAYSMLVQYYYGYGDSFNYYVGGNFFIDQIQSNISNVKYLFTPAPELQQIYATVEGRVGGVNGYIATTSAVIIMKISAVVAVVSFNKFLITSLFFGLFSFAGQWKLFLVFNDINKGKNQKLMAFAVLYSPAIWFWGSGLMKESICMGALGFIVSILYNAFVKKKISLRDWIVLIVMIYFAYSVKSYMIMILAATLTLTALFLLFQKIKFIVVRVFLILITILAIYFSLSLTDFSDQINDLAEESVLQIENFKKGYDALQNEEENSKAGFEMAAIDPSFESMLLRSPGVVFSCLFRPFLWESRKLIILLSSLESTLLLLCTFFLLFKARFFGFFKLVITNHYVFFCFIITVLFALIIGFTTFNFGTMTRYKIVLLPFFYFMLVYMYTILTDKREENNAAESLAV